MLKKSFCICIFSLLWTATAKASEFERVPNTTLHFPVQAERGEFFLTNAFGELQFENPVAVASPPGDPARIFVIERRGKIFILEDAASPPELFLDISDRVNSDYKNQGAEGLTSIAFHPGFETNRLFYLAYSTTATTADGTGRHNRLARFTAAPSAWIGVPESETPLITQFDEGVGHNLNDLQFGPDGYLYVAIGDEGESHDNWANSWRIDKDFFSAILRIDVDQRPDNLDPNPHPASHGNYRVPADNPFVGLTEYQGVAVLPAEIRTEFWAIGFRNPWRMTFHPGTGELFVADVGQHAWEELNIVTAGGNYGWAFFEGFAKGFRGDAPPGYSAILPLHAYRHGAGQFEGASITGGAFYRSTLIPPLSDAYVFGDFMSGNLWALRSEGGQVTAVEYLLNDPGIASFGIDPATGDILAVDHDEGLIKRLRFSDPGESNIPGLLSETGAFSDLATLDPEPGIYPYTVNVPFWSDAAAKRRWFSLPDPAQTFVFHPEESWQTPPGAVWIKHFDLELISGEPASARRIETRFLIRTSEGVYGLSYQWNEDQTDAVLVDAEGADQTFNIQEGGGTREQVWRFPSRGECLQCHTAAAGLVLSWNTAQINRPGPGSSANQVTGLSDAGFFDAPAPQPHLLRALAHYDDLDSSREYRARSYLEANCAPCHRPNGTAPGFWDARISTPTSFANLVNGPLTAPGQNADIRVIVPGDPNLSMLLARISTRGQGQMPPLSTSIVDPHGIRLLTDWIGDDLPERETFFQWQARIFSPENQHLNDPDQDADNDGVLNYAEFLIGSDPLVPEKAWTVEFSQTEDGVRLSFPAQANRAFAIEFAPHLAVPVEWRPLPHPANRPFFFPPEDLQLELTDTLIDSSRYYRIQIREP